MRRPNIISALCERVSATADPILTATAAFTLAEGRRGRNIRHRLLGLLRQGVVTLTAAGRAQGNACGFASPHTMARTHVISDQTPKATLR
jgi:hypothetical protein